MHHLTGRVALALVLLCGTGGLAHAGSDAKNRVLAKLQDGGYAEETLMWLHLGSTLRSAKAVSTGTVIDQNTGQVIPGAFSVQMRYYWDFLGKEGYTDLVLFFDKDGRSTLQGFNKGTTTAAVLKHFDELRAIAEVAKAVGKPAAKKAVEKVISNQDLRELVLSIIDSIIDIPTVEGAYRAKLSSDFQ